MINYRTMNILNRTQQVYKKRPKTALAVIFVAVVGIVLFTQKPAEDTSKNRPVRVPSVELIDISSTDTTGSISVTGEVEALAQVELRSQVSEPVRFVGAKIGDHVFRGQTLVTLSNGELSAQIQQAEAGVLIAQAQLAEVERGSRNEQLNAADTAVFDAQRSLEAAEAQAATQLSNLYDQVPTTISNIIVQLNDALYIYTRDLFDDDRGAVYPSLTFITANTTAQVLAEQQRGDAFQALTQIENEFALIDRTSKVALDAILRRMETNIAIVQTFINTVNKTLTSSTLLDEAILAQHKSNISIARSSVNGAQGSIEGLRQGIAAQESANERALTSAENTLNTTQDAVTVVEAGSSKEQIDAAKAAVLSAQANVNQLRARIGKTIFVSPINGTVATIPARVGDLLRAGDLVATVINTAGLQVKVFVSSSDSSLLAVGNQTMVNEKVRGTVANIAPSIDPETSKVEVIVAITEASAALVVGEFVSVAISSAQRESALIIVPLSAIKTVDESSFVYRIDNGVLSEIPVAVERITGSRAEILFDTTNVTMIVKSVRGLSAGDKVVLAE